MSQEKKITDAEFAEIKMLQSKFQTTIEKFGILGVERLDLKRAQDEFIEKEKKLENEWGNLQKMERDLMDRILKTYGEGNLNMTDGTITSSK